MLDSCYETNRQGVMEYNFTSSYSVCVLQPVTSPSAGLHGDLSVHPFSRFAAVVSPPTMDNLVSQRPEL